MVTTREPQAWIKLPNLAPATVIELSRGATQITLFEREAGTQDWKVSRTGETIPTSQRAMQVPEMAFRLAQFESDKAERYLLIEQQTHVTYTIDAWNAAAFERSSDNRLMVRLFLLGFCGAMIAFNMVVALITRQKLFALNAAFILTVIPIGFVIEGTGPFLFWPESPDWTRTVMTISRAGSALFSAHFIAEFLAEGGLNNKPLQASKVAGLLICFGFLSVLLTDHALTYVAMIAASGLLMLAQFALVVSSVAQGDRNARLFLIPAAILTAGFSFRFATMQFSIDQPWLRYHTIELTLALEALAFSLILASKIKAYAATSANTRASLAELRLQSANRFSSLQDKFRSNIASTLHDSVGHALAIASAHLKGIEPKGTQNGAGAAKLVDAKEALDLAISETRRISHELHPVRLEHLGLKRSLEEVAGELSSVHDIAATTNFVFEEGLLSADQSMHIYRVAQEACLNIIKHSKATQCVISLCQMDSRLHFSMSDDGVGFDPKEQPNGQGIGLFSMKQRVLQIGSELQIDSETGGGLVLAFILDLDATN
ncbi:MAG: 7TM diverse intracellular signaling domain-containing protein [Erythrobacter sp.]|uniref:sensor histidine kinase n=1 Tax=Erythrobacter sp. TaxID=1042 RepID=UPI00329810A0